MPEWNWLKINHLHIFRFTSASVINSIWLLSCTLKQIHTALFGRGGWLKLICLDFLKYTGKTHHAAFPLKAPCAFVTLTLTGNKEILNISVHGWGGCRFIFASYSICCRLCGFQAVSFWTRRRWLKGEEEELCSLWTHVISQMRAVVFKVCPSLFFFFFFTRQVKNATCSGLGQMRVILK